MGEIVLDPIAAGARALETGAWADASTHFAAAISAGGAAEAYLGLARARWFLGDVDEAFEARTLAYRALRSEGRLADAAESAVWLAREHRRLYRNDVVADGWLERARTVAALAGDPIARGWADLAGAEAAPTIVGALALARDAVAAGRQERDGDLEIVALARAAVLEVMAGDVESGVAHLDEAMVAATAGEGDDPQSLGEACCALTEVVELLGDPERFAGWADVVVRYRSSHAFPPLTAHAEGRMADELSAFCGACGGGIYLVTGRLDEAEAELQAAIDALGDGKLSSHCVHPVVQLAELRVVQGRDAEAAALLEAFADLPESVRPLAALDLIRGDPRRAASRLRARLGALDDRVVVAFPLWLLLVDAELAAGEVPSAEGAAAQAARIAGTTASARHGAEAAFAVAKVVAARKPADARPRLREASERLASAGLMLEASRARMAFAIASLPDDRETAVVEAMGSLAAFDRLGARSDADSAAQFLRRLGVRGRTGDKRPGELSDREREVLGLLSIGMTDAEIGERLHISRKTVGHHVSSILMKLDVRSRTEAAAYAALHGLWRPAVE